jgi:GNAT superfamily N-acetyltransferase
MRAQADVVMELVDEAAQWLRGKDTDQWEVPWPDASGRDKRIQDDVRAGRTWIAWNEDVGIGVGTITLDENHPVDGAENPVWPVHHLRERALYVHRVVVSRRYSGLGLGAGLLDWASGKAMALIGTPLLRIDVWTDNAALHEYYKRQGFEYLITRDEKDLPDYPARALFERRTSPNGRNGSGLFHEYPSASRRNG